MSWRRRVRSTHRPARRLHGARRRASRDLAGRPDAMRRRSSRRSSPSTRFTLPTGTIARRAPRARGDAVRDSDEARFFLAVAFPSDQLRILPYNRVVRDLNGMTPEHFLGEVARTFAMTSGPATPEEKGQVSMYVAGKWHTVDLESGGVPGAGVIDDARLQRAAGTAAEAHSRHSGCAHRQAHRFRRRREGHADARAAGRQRQDGCRVFDVSGQRRRADGRVGCGRDHAAEIDVVRAKTSRWIADS